MGHPSSSAKKRRLISIMGGGGWWGSGVEYREISLNPVSASEMQGVRFAATAATSMRAAVLLVVGKHFVLRRFKARHMVRAAASLSASMLHVLCIWELASEYG